jgi:hypothetical protein
MRVLVEGRTYESTYFPFFLKKQRLDYSIYTFRLPSGAIEEIFVFDRNNYLQELQDYVKYMIEQFVLEDDAMLTPRAQQLKRDLSELFRQV